ncbi:MULTISPECIES: GyrI-like domain-containing protein [Arthrobacter]|uniref:GyrI-like domain-containing protein n=2 Tax=Arthrobacter TaxID=1663 RepID=A0ABU9KFV3_9MICC|nr:GyrI-like domain-containing protein [Arthrobacter sp. YJM1]MDP5225755.1 GyrI-like domain-containing protein [Arthrobacter sp. YJM1]
MPFKTDFKKTLDRYRARQGDFRVLEVPETRYLVIDGHGDPNTSPAFAEALAALYPVAYKLKFAARDATGEDYVVPPLEGLWWADDMEAFTTARDKSRWDWTVMLMVPEHVPGDLVTLAVERAGAKNPPLRLGEVRLETLMEGRCVQTLHVGSFEAEAVVLNRLHHDVIPGLGLGLRGKHHEIYLSDFRKTAPEKQRTILRQPVAEA